MKLTILETQLQKLLDTSSEFAAALKNAQTNFGEDISESDIQYMRLIEEIKRNLSDVRRSVCQIREKIEQIKSLEGIV